MKMKKQKSPVVRICVALRFFLRLPTRKTSALDFGALESTQWLLALCGEPRQLFPRMMTVGEPGGWPEKLESRDVGNDLLHVGN